MLKSNLSTCWGSARKAGVLTIPLFLHFPGRTKAINSGANPQEELPTVEEIDEMTDLLYQEFQTGILQAVDYLKNVSPALLQMQYGLELSASEEYYLDEAGYIRETRSTYNINAEHEMLETMLGTSKLSLTYVPYKQVGATFFCPGR